MSRPHNLSVFKVSVGKMSYLSVFQVFVEKIFCHHNMPVFPVSVGKMSHPHNLPMFQVCLGKISYLPMFQVSLGKMSYLSVFQMSLWKMSYLSVFPVSVGKVSYLSVFQVSVGKMSRRHNMTVALYSATTCPGSSGAPVVRLSHDYMHYVAAGQFVHHGYDGYDEDTATGMGSLRPPITLPYCKALDVGRVRQAVAILYEPVSYWALYLTDVMEVEGVLFNCTDNFCYFLHGFFCGWHHPRTVVAFLGFVVVISCQMILFGLRGPRYALLHVIHLLHALSMHWVTWLACVTVPRDCQSLLWVAPLWFAVLFLSRHTSVAHLLGLDLFHAMLKCKL